MPPLSHQQLAAAVLMFHRPSRVSPMHDARRSQPESRRYGLPRSPTLDIVDRFPLVAVVQHDPSQHPNCEESTLSSTGAPRSLRAPASLAPVVGT
ncbi:BZ3500_MvSof-1268-A1-R1_Chr11-2g03471 [Microbotryum saponariae]|uniref:BZ3500_MvSof-1268-A1-R1_Chr11-2g03471 protein n=1 Tax=Microbotryum saponariae TaxID=289078 RepID=A0A2X0KUD5_9BASI|nr:BZ3500_MvSof-1268-A1-R1_Chr11-2g03471 [Microbotryum saponariae]SDA03439.1 BZ3501_MvSof-1269-A2-R1_Chr11g03042 [Microbotryum saponariae]